MYNWEKQFYFNRMFELAVAKYHKHGFIVDPVYLSMGTELVPVFLKQSLLYNKLDYVIFPQHRCHSWYLTFGGDIKSLITNLVGQGKQGSASLHIPNIMFGHDGLLGSNASIACGYSYATKKYTICHLGDAAVEEDYVLSSLGFAATYKLPILFIVEDNNLSILTKKSDRRSWNIIDVAKSFGLYAYDTHLNEIFNLLHNKTSYNWLFDYDCSVLININCDRYLWHSGSGSDGEVIDNWCEQLQLSDQEKQYINNYIYKAFMTLREQICAIVDQHTKNGGIVAAQNLIGVGACQNTVPERLTIRGETGALNLPTSDVMNPGLMCGIALSNLRPIYIIRFQGFLTYNAASLVNYAAISKSMWDQPCPVFIRGIGVSNNIGPVASNTRIGQILHYPGIKVMSPCTPHEYLETWNNFLQNDDPVFCSEHRSTYDVSDSSKWLHVNYSYNRNSKITIIKIGCTRLNKYDLFNEINLYHIKPLYFNLEQLKIIKNSELCVITHSDYTDCGVGQYIAYHIMNEFNIKTIDIGIDDRFTGFGVFDNLPPSISKVVEIIHANLP